MIIQAILIAFSFAHAGQIDPALLQNMTPSAEVIILLDPTCVSTPVASVQLLKQQSQECAFNVGTAAGIKRRNIRPLWISHSTAATVNKAQLKSLALNPLVKKIYLNQGFKSALFSDNEFASTPYNLKQISWDQLHANFPSLDGRDQLIGIIDTGIDGSHPALKDKIETFFDADENKITPATDRAGHGTHVAGLLVANGVGVAPSAKLVAAKMLNIESALRAMQFIVDYNSKNAKKIQVVNNSWGEQDLPDIELYYRALNLWQSLNIIPVFSAGNLGPKEKTVVHPKEHPATIVVGSTQEDGTIPKYSSRGPIEYHGETLFKPELVAPGDKIVSTLPDGRFGPWSGTSMSAPLVTGTIALMLQASPKLNPQQVRKLLIGSTTSNERKWTSDRGYGLLNTYAAVIGAMNFMPQSSLTILNLGLKALPAKDEGLNRYFNFPQNLEGKFILFPSLE